MLPAFGGRDRAQEGGTTYGILVDLDHWGQKDLGLVQGVDSSAWFLKVQGFRGWRLMALRGLRDSGL